VKYIALLALAKIVPTHRSLVAKYQDMIISSISDQDLSIRMRALDLLSAMVRSVYSLSFDQTSGYDTTPGNER
jgi:AP-3 complex subunit delta